MNMDNSLNIPHTYELKADSLFFSRDKEMQYLEVLLNKKRRSNIIIIGESGSGKTTLITQLSKKYKIIGLDIADLISGTQYRGSFEKRIQNIINLCHEEKVILFIDEIHSLYSLGKSEGGISVLDILKPILNDNKIVVIGCTTIDEYSILTQDKAFLRRFFTCKVNPISYSSIKENIESIIANMQIDREISIDKDTALQLLNYCKRNIANNLLLDRYLDYLDTVFALAKIKNHNKIDNTNIHELISIIKTLEVI